MSTRAMRWAWESIRNAKDMAPRCALVLLALADCHNQETGRCDPSVQYLSRKTRLAERTVRMSLRDLEALRLVKTTFRQQSTGRGKKNKTSRYALLGGAQFAGGLVQGVGHDVPPNMETYARPNPPSKWTDLVTDCDDDDVVVPLPRRAGHA